MAVTIVTGTDTLDSTSYISQAELVAVVRRHGGGGFAERALAVTVPSLPFTITPLGYEGGTGRNRRNIRYDSGTITLNLRQQVYMSSDLSECARRCWMVHEEAHVADNRAVLAGLEAELRRDATFMSYIDGVTWQPASHMTRMVRYMERLISRTFTRMTGAAVTARDNDAEYNRIRANVRRECGADDPAGAGT
jgi:hypothetical protein